MDMIQSQEVSIVLPTSIRRVSKPHKTKIGHNKSKNEAAKNIIASEGDLSIFFEASPNA